MGRGTGETRAVASAWSSALVALLFLLSGMTALVYEVVWFKRCAHVFGAAPIAIAAVVASFLLGLGLGARLLGGLADRVRRPLLSYGWCELGIGLLALALPLELSALGALEARAYPLVAGHPLLGALLRCALTFLVLGPPCALMGGTLPLLLKGYPGLGAGMARSTGLLYAVNALGGAAGAYLAGFHLLPALGIEAVTRLAAGANLAVGAAALALGALSAGRAPKAPDPSPLAGAERPARPRLAPAIACALGASALMLQVVWMRQMALLVGGSTYAFSAVLVMVLLGIGLGSLAFRPGAEGLGAGSLRARVQGLLAALACAVVAGQLALPLLTDLVSSAVELRASAVHNAVVCLLAGAALALAPSLAFGCLFPALVAAHFRGAGTEGRTVGAIAWWNTLGCLAGATATPLVLVPALGTHAAAGAAVGLLLIALLLAEGLGPRWRPGRTCAAGLLGLALVLLAGRPQDPLRLNLGTYSSGYQPPEKQREELLFFREGRACNVLVTAGKNRALRLNGKVDAGDAHDMPTQLGCACFGLFLRPRARDALVLGFGSGTTSGALLQDPKVHVTCCEIEAQVLAASPFFAHVNHSPERSPRFSSLVLDGRSHLQGAHAEYDLIVSVPSNPWVAGIGNLFTREFYAAAHGRLRPGGLLVQWVQTYELPPEDYALVVRTLSSVFEQVGIVRIDDLDTLVVASDAALVPARGELAAAQALVDAQPAIAADLERWFGTRSVSRLLLRHFAVGPDGVRRLLAAFPGDELHTDDNLRLEFDSARRLFAYTPETDALVLSGVDAAWQRELCERLPDAAGAAPEWRSLYDALEDAGLAGRDALAAAGRELAPGDPFLRARALLAQPPGDGEPFRAAVLALAEDSPPQANQLGALYWQGGDYRRAARVYEVLLERWPHAATLWANLSTCQRPLGDEAGAGRSLGRALELDPWNEFVGREAKKRQP